MVYLDCAPMVGMMTTEGVRSANIEGMIQQMKDEVPTMKGELLEEPKAVETAELYLKVADTVRAEGKTIGRLRAVRLIGGTAVTVVAAVTSEDAKVRERILGEVEKGLLGKIRVAKWEGKEVGVGKTGMKFVAPAGYEAEVRDVAEGVVAVLTNKKYPDRKIVVTVAGNGDKAVELESGEMKLAGEIGGGGEWEVCVDGRYQRRVRRVGGPDLGRWVQETRQIKAGGKVVAVGMVCPPHEEEEAARDADEVAGSLLR